VPGDGRYEWEGFYAGTDFPEVFNPPQGFFATANQYTLPEPTGARFSYDGWTNPDRWKRLVRVLSEDSQHSMEDSKNLQSDMVSGRVQGLVDMIRPLQSADPLTAEALALLKNWDLVERVTGQPGAAQARLAETYWLTRVNQAVLALLVPNAADRTLINNSADWLYVWEVLQNPNAYFGSNGEAQRNALLLSTLRAAYEAARTALGTNVSTWTWGTAINMNHPLGDRDPSLTVTNPPKGGSGTSPLANQAASFKMVINVGDWDNSVALNAPGQSGVPGSPHYRDLAPMWWANEYFPLLYTRPAIAQATESRIVLLPAP
jgi:penicillin amidase